MASLLIASNLDKLKTSKLNEMNYMHAKDMYTLIYIVICVTKI